MLGMLLMPLLPAGSRYVGVDFTKTMIGAAEQCFGEMGIQAQFVLSDVMEYRPAHSYDPVISQGVLFVCGECNGGEVVPNGV